jgi:hypothetical protein
LENTMNMSTTLNHPSLTRRAAQTGPILQRLTAWFQRSSSLASASHHTSDTAAALYARAAAYESSQPGFAADLRAAAEAMDRSAAKAAR